MSSELIERLDAYQREGHTGSIIERELLFACRVRIAELAKQVERDGLLLRDEARYIKRLEAERDELEAEVAQLRTRFHEQDQWDEQG